MTDLAVPGSVELASLRQEAEDNAENAQAPATIRAYRFDWACFASWCTSHGLASLPAEPGTVALYITDLAKRRKTATVSRRLTTIARAHHEQDLPSPVDSPAVKQVWKGIRRRYGVAKTGKAAAKTNEIRLMIDTLDLNRLIGIRDRCLLLIGFSGALRRSELVALDVPDVVEGTDGLTVRLKSSKTDQEGEGYELGLTFGSEPLTCPVRAYRDWRAASGIDDGPIFRAITRHGRMASTRLTDRTVARVVQRCALRAGLDPSQYAGHSLRAGMITQAAENGQQEWKIMEHSRHKSVTVLRGYIRKGTLFKNNPTAGLGL